MIYSSLHPGQDHAAELELARLAQDMKRAEMQVELVAR